jgi:hypothetical protein
MRKSASPTPWQRVLKLDRFLDYHAPLLFLLLLLFILRLPNYFEPYWYGDEGIYLTIGTALTHGRELYAEIVDHKTPLIYFFAQVSDQLYFRLLLTAWMLLSTVLFYALACRLHGERLSATLATLVFVVFTTLPWFEGNIPNGELFVIGFVLLGGVLMLKSTLFQRFLSTNTIPTTAPKQTHFVFLAGLSFGLAILTKVPGLFDMLAFLSVGFLLLTNSVSFSPTQDRSFKKLALETTEQVMIVLAGAATAIIASILFFYSRGTLAAYLEYGLLYNFRYAGSFGLPFEHPLLLAAFSLPGKGIITAGSIFIVVLLRRFLRPVHQFALIWFSLALFASLLSNRPYPHYFLQVVPPLALLLGSIVQQWRNHRAQSKQPATTQPTASKLGQAAELSRTYAKVLTLSGVLALSGFILVLSLLKVGFYPTASYYTNWWNVVTNQQSPAEYRNSFNHLMKDNYDAAPILATAEDKTIFIWGNNPMLYALSKTIPAGRFTVAFHISDFNAYDETMTSITRSKPEYIVTMHDETHDFPALHRYVQLNYIENTSFEHFSIWRRRTF